MKSLRFAESSNSRKLEKFDEAVREFEEGLGGNGAAAGGANHLTPASASPVDQTHEEMKRATISVKWNSLRCLLIDIFLYYG